jgi:WD40 repeat protein
MNLKTLSLFIFSVFTFPGILLADPGPPETIKHPESKCIIEKSGGEYPTYIVKTGEKVLYSPKSDGIIKALFSPSGKYLAFSGSEIDLVDIDEEHFSVVVLNCDSGIMNGFMKGFPSGEKSISMSWVDDNTLKYFDTASEKEIILKIISQPKGSFQLSEKAFSIK